MHMHTDTLPACPSLCVTSQSLCVCVCGEKAEGVLQLWLTGGVGTVTDSQTRRLRGAVSLCSGLTSKPESEPQDVEANQKQRRLDGATFPFFHTLKKLIGLCNDSHHSYLVSGQRRRLKGRNLAVVSKRLWVKRGIHYLRLQTPAFRIRHGWRQNVDDEAVG